MFISSVNDSFQSIPDNANRDIKKLLFTSFPNFEPNVSTHTDYKDDA